MKNVKLPVIYLFVLIILFSLCGIAKAGENDCDVVITNEVPGQIAMPSDVTAVQLHFYYGVYYLPGETPADVSINHYDDGSRDTIQSTIKALYPHYSIVRIIQVNKSDFMGDVKTRYFVYIRHK